MIIFTVCTQNGDSEYREWSFTDQITKDFKEFVDHKEGEENEQLKNNLR